MRQRPSFECAESIGGSHPGRDFSSKRQIGPWTNLYEGAARRPQQRRAPRGHIEGTAPGSTKIVSMGGRRGTKAREILRDFSICAQFVPCCRKALSEG